MRVGLSQRIGKGTSVHVGKNINPGGCVKWLLYFIFLPMQVPLSLYAQVPLHSCFT